LQQVNNVYFDGIKHPATMTRLFSLVILLTLAACTSSSSFSEEDKQTVATDVRQTLYKYYEDIQALGLKAELSYLDSSKDFFWVPPGYDEHISYDSVVQFIKQNAPLFQTVSNKWDTLRVIPLTNELASYTGTLLSTVTDTMGITETYPLIETGLMIKRSNGWKLLNGQTAALP
jgi:hypothetical protein